MDAPIDITAYRHAQDLRDSWQGRMLRATQRREIGAVVLSMLGHAFDAEILQVLLMATFPGFKSIGRPFICSAARVTWSGAVVADVVDRDESIRKECVIFRSLDDMKSKLRRLADRMKLDDQERLEFFAIAQKWVVADRRLDPAMDPQDPDAKRIVHH